MEKVIIFFVFFFQAEDGIRDGTVTGVQTCALPISAHGHGVAGVKPGALEIGDHEQLQADGAAADDQYAFARYYPSFLDGFQNRVDRLNKRGFFKADVIGQRYDSAFGYPGHGFDVFGEATAVGGEPAGEACRLVLLALREEATLAIETIAAGYVMETHHTVALDPLRYAAAHCYDRAGYFMAQNLRRRNVGVINLLDVGAADAASGDFDEHFAIAHFWDGDFLDANDSLSAVDTGAHSLGDGPESVQGFANDADAGHTVTAFFRIPDNASAN